MRPFVLILASVFVSVSAFPGMFDKIPEILPTPNFNEAVKITQQLANVKIPDKRIMEFFVAGISSPKFPLWLRATHAINNWSQPFLLSSDEPNEKDAQTFRTYFKDLEFTFDFLRKESCSPERVWNIAQTHNAGFLVRACHPKDEKLNDEYMFLHSD